MLAYFFVLLAVATRFLPHPLAFTPVGAALLFFGARGSRRTMWIPLSLLAASDIYLTVARYSYPLTVDHLVTWVWYAAVMLGASMWLRRGARAIHIAAAALATSLSFFVISNFAVWAVWGDLYPRTWQGLAACYVAAVPFFRNQLVADMFFTAVMFSIPMVLDVLHPGKSRKYTEAA